jgi:hypothetical protein
MPRSENHSEVKNVHEPQKTPSHTAAHVERSLRLDWLDYLGFPSENRSQNPPHGIERLHNARFCQGIRDARSFSIGHDQ